MDLILERGCTSAPVFAAALARLQVETPWFESEDTAWPYSFANSCQALGFEVTYIRAGLRRWARNARAHSAASR
jgi:hypothetical protein